VPVIVTIVDQDDVADLRSNAERYQVLEQAIVRAAFDAYAQDGVLTCTDLGLLFNRSYTRVAAIIREYEEETGEIVPRRGNVHDMGRTVTHNERAIVVNSRHTSRQVHYTPIGTIAGPLGGVAGSESRCRIKGKSTTNTLNSTSALCCERVMQSLI